MSEEQESDYMAELEAAADQHLSEKQDLEDEETLPSEETRSGDESTGDNESQGDGDEGNDDEGDDAGDENPGGNSVSDELLERAVKVGLSLQEAKKYTDASMLGHVCDRLEELSDAEDSDGDESSGGGEAEENPLDLIPDLDPEEVNESIVEAFNGLKEFAGRLFTENKELKALSQKEVSPQGTWADAKFSELGGAFEDIFGKGDFSDLPKDSSEARSRQRLERHMNFILEDAKEAGEHMTRAEAFQKALEAQYGDIIEKEKGKVAAAAAKKRSKLVLNQPRNTDGRFGSKDDFGSEGDRKEAAVAAVHKMMEEDN